MGMSDEFNNQVIKSIQRKARLTDKQDIAQMINSHAVLTIFSTIVTLILLLIVKELTDYSLYYLGAIEFEIETILCVAAIVFMVVIAIKAVITIKSNHKTEKILYYSKDKEISTELRENITKISILALLKQIKYLKLLMIASKFVMLIPIVAMIASMDFSIDSIIAAIIIETIVFLAGYIPLAIVIKSKTSYIKKLKEQL